MRFVLERIIGPDDTVDVVTVTEIKRHLGEFASVSDRDTDIQDLIDAAVEWAEDYTGRVLVDQTWRLTVGPDTFDNTTADAASTWSADVGGDGIYLRKSPALAITRLATVDAITGAETVIDADTYELRESASKWPRLVLLSGAWSAGTTRVTFRAGYCDRTGSPVQAATVIPARYRSAIKLHVEAHYDRSTDMDKLLKAAENLLKPERCEMGFS